MWEDEVAGQWWRWAGHASRTVAREPTRRMVAKTGERAEYNSTDPGRMRTGAWGTDVGTNFFKHTSTGPLAAPRPREEAAQSPELWIEQKVRFVARVTRTRSEQVQLAIRGNFRQARDEGWLDVTRRYSSHGMGSRCRTACPDALFASSDRCRPFRLRTYMLWQEDAGPRGKRGVNKQHNFFGRCSTPNKILSNPLVVPAIATHIGELHERATHEV